jgi:hypothetical protein
LSMAQPHTAAARQALALLLKDGVQGPIRDGTLSNDGHTGWRSYRSSGT